MMLTTAVIAVLAVLLYLGACALWPSAACRRCKGRGRFTAVYGGTSWRPCPRCGGSGSRTRVGRKILDRLDRAGR